MVGPVPLENPVTLPEPDVIHPNVEEATCDANGIVMVPGEHKVKLSVEFVTWGLGFTTTV